MRTLKETYESGLTISPKDQISFIDWIREVKHELVNWTELREDEDKDLREYANSADFYMNDEEMRTMYYYKIMALLKCYVKGC